MASFYRATVGDFLNQPLEHVLANLATSYANRGYTSQYSDQTLTWQRDLLSLQKTLRACIARSDHAKSWGLILEFSIPRKEHRIDVVLLLQNLIVIVETKTGEINSQAKRQIEQYALLLHYFHKASDKHRILPIVVSKTSDPVANRDFSDCQPYPQLANHWIAPVARSSWEDLSDFLTKIESEENGLTTVEEWDESPYFPVPSIIDAALALRSGLSIPEIAHSEASEHDIDSVRKTVQDYVDHARTNSKHIICFLTGVPGSGKTLVGLSLAHGSENRSNAIHFMSGNGPLVKVLQHLFKTESMDRGASSPQAEAEAKTLLENVHVFARYHTEDNLGPPSNHAIIFDEAQRAWNKAQNLKKFGRDYSEPEMLLRIMERHSDWAIVIALIGGGQEINDGEAGLEEWGRALTGSAKDWVIYASPEVLDAGPSTAGHCLFEDIQSKKRILTNSTLHLRTSNRSLRAEQLATWVNLVLEGKAEGAAALKITKRFPIFLSRDLAETREKLHEQRRGANRYGLVGSSRATRLRAVGLEPSSSLHAEYPWEHWYLAEETDIRSSYRCEIFATEFEIQGLELDWIGLCWGGDFIRNEEGTWDIRELRHGVVSKWSLIKKEEKKIYRKNAYRVLLTRARQGMIIFVPPGDSLDSTNLSKEFDRTAEYLLRCGVVPFEKG